MCVIRREAQLWIRAAEEDLEDAELALKFNRWFRVAFYAHQCVEKLLKALFFIVRREEPPKIHVVTELYDLLRESGFTLPKDIEDELPILNKYYTVTRYPDAANGLPSQSVDKIEALRAYNLAKRVYEWIRKFTETHC